MLNKIIVMGRLVRDPELRHTTQNNTSVCPFRIAVDRDRKGPNGEKQTDFLDCVAWGRQAEFVSQWFNKGTMAIVVGRLQTRNWQDPNGNNRIAYEIQCDEISFGETKKARENYTGEYSAAPQSRPAAAAAPVAPAFDLPTDSSDSDFVDLIGEDGDVPF